MSRDGLEQHDEPMPIVETEQCNGCGLCVRVCTNRAMAIHEGKAFISRPDACIYCGLCERICPVQAICLPIEIVFSDGSEERVGSEPEGSRREAK